MRLQLKFELKSIFSLPFRAEEEDDEDEDDDDDEDGGEEMTKADFLRYFEEPLDDSSDLTSSIRYRRDLCHGAIQKVSKCYTNRRLLAVFSGSIHTHNFFLSGSTSDYGSG
jgi:hypothetical protein